MIHVDSDWSAVEAEIDRLTVMPNPKMTAALRGVLDLGLGLTVAAVHVDTGSLKSSLRTEEDISYASGRWTGTIHGGGPSKGVNNPVDYAIYEKRRGGAHDFFDELPTLHPLYVAAIMEGLK